MVFDKKRGTPLSNRININIQQRLSLLTNEDKITKEIVKSFLAALDLFHADKDRWTGQMMTVRVKQRFISFMTA